MAHPPTARCTDHDERAQARRGAAGPDPRTAQSRSATSGGGSSRRILPGPARAPAAADVHDGRPPWTPPAPRACRTPDLAASVWNRKRTGSRAEPTDNTSSDDCRAHCGLRSADRTGRRPGLPGNTAPGRATDRRPLPARKLVDDYAQYAQICRDAASGIIKRAAPNPRLSPGGLGPHLTSSGFPCGLSSGFPFARRVLPPSSAFLRFPFVRHSPVCSLRPLPSSSSPSVSLRVPFPLSCLHVSAAAGRFRRRWSRSAGTKVTGSAATTSP